MPRAFACFFATVLVVTICLSKTSSVATAQPAQPAAANAQAAQAQADQDAREQAAIDQALRAQAQQQEDPANFGGGFGQAQVGRGGRGGPSTRAGRGRGTGTSTAQLRSFLNEGSITPEQYQQLMGDRVQSLSATPNPAAVTDSTEPKDLIALNLWVLTIDLPKAKAADDITASIVSRANDLPTVIGSRDDVRVLIGKLTVAGVLARSREYRVTTVSGQPVSIQSGGNQPQVIATQFGGVRGGGGGGRINQIQYQNVGTNIQLQPRTVAGGNVDVTFTYNSSDLEEARNVALAEGDDANRVPATRTTTQQIQATTRVKGGSAVLLQSEVVAEPNNEASAIRTQLIILGANIIPTADK